MFPGTGDTGHHLQLPVCPLCLSLCLTHPGPAAPLALPWELREQLWGHQGLDMGHPGKLHWRTAENWPGLQGKGRGLSWGSENHGNEGVTEEYQLQLRHQERGLGV